MARIWVWLKSICSWGYEPHLKWKGSFKDSQWKCKYHQMNFSAVSSQIRRCKPRNATCHPRRCDVINDVKLFPTVSQDILSQILDIIQSEDARYKSKCIRMHFRLILILEVNTITCNSDKILASKVYEPWHEISNNVVCATSKAPDQPAHTRSLISAFASRLNILWVSSNWLYMIWSF